MLASNTHLLADAPSPCLLRLRYRQLSDGLSVQFQVHELVLTMAGQAWSPCDGGPD